MIKIAFFDIDGTLVSFKTHGVPESTHRAIQALRESGVKTVIASGRDFPEISPEVISQGFDAFILLNGQKCVCDGEVYRSCPLDAADVRAIVDQAESGLYDVIVKLDNYSFANRRSERILALSEQVNTPYPVDDIQLARENPVYQFCAFIDPDLDHIILDATSSVTTTRWTDSFCDVVPAHGGKDLGVAATLEHFGFTAEEAIAFGDGENDLSMLRAVGTGVAMGNAWEQVKEQADYITDDVDSDGIWNACRHFGLV